MTEIFSVRCDTHQKGRNRYIDLPSIRLGEFHLMDIVTIEGKKYKIVGFGLGTDSMVYVEKAAHYLDQKAILERVYFNATSQSLLDKSEGRG